MISALQGEIGINVIASIIASLVFLAAGFVWGKYKERRRKFGRNLDDMISTRSQLAARTLASSV